MKNKTNKNLLVPDEVIINKIYLIRGEKVMLDRDLADMYGVETKVLKQAVNRNIRRFPDDFMFQMNEEEFKNWRSQIVTSNSDRMGLRYAPYCFTEQGVAMLSGILNSDIAIEVNIQIIRIFTKMRAMLSTHKDVLLKLEQLENKQNKNDKEIQFLFQAIRELMNPPNPPRKKIGFKIGKK